MLSAINIIIADDHRLVRKGIESVLKSFNFVDKIAHAENGKLVISILKQEHFDMVFMDVDMPEMNGVETTEIITKQFPNVKVLAISMHDDRNHVFEMLEKGAMGYILKDTHPDEIENAIKDLINNKKYFCSKIANVIIEDYKQKVERNANNSQQSELKERLREVVFLICNEFDNQEIANALFLSKSTIESYRKEAMQKLKCKGSAGLYKFGFESGLYKESSLMMKFNRLISEKRKK